MAALEKVMQMRGNGLSDYQIIQSLKQEGVSPKEINDALSQSKIKNAISNESYADDENLPEIEGDNLPPSYTNQNMPKGFQASGFPAENQDYPVQQKFQQSPQYPPAQQQYPPAQYIEEQPYQDQSPVQTQMEQNPEVFQEYPPEYNQEYAQDKTYPEYEQRPILDVESVNEICDQIITNREEKIKKQISEFNKFKEESQSRIENFKVRLEKIEGTIEELKMAILRRIGEYGEDIRSIAREMQVTQDSFSKVIDPLTDNIKELKKVTKDLMPEREISQENNSEESNPPSERKSSKRTDNDFESYLR
jgi:hypothetical protein